MNKGLSLLFRGIKLSTQVKIIFKTTLPVIQFIIDRLYS